MSGTSRGWTSSADLLRTTTRSRCGSFNHNPTMNRYSFIAALLWAGVLSACSKDPVRDISGPPPAASRIRFFNFGVNAPGVNFYANATKMTAITTSTAGGGPTNGVAYGGVGAGGAYEAFAPGQYTLTGKIAATTDKDLAISPLPTTI